MKKMLLYFIIFLIIPLMGNFAKAQNSDTNSFLNYVPANSILLIKAHSISKLYNTFVIDKNNFFGIDIKKDIASIKKDLIINPFNIKDLKKNGIDINSEVGISISDLGNTSNSHQEQLMISFFIPSKKTKKTLSFLNSLVKKNMPKGAKYSYKNNTHLYLHSKTNMSLQTKKNYIQFSVIINSLLTVSDMDEQKNILEDENYKKIIPKINQDEDIFVYMDMTKLLKLTAMARNARLGLAQFYQQYDDYKNAAMTINLDNSDLLINMVSMYKENAATLKMYEKEFTNGAITKIQPQAALLVLTAINYPVLVKLLKNSNPEQLFQELDKELGINTKSDIIDTLEPGISFGVFDAASISAINYNSILLLKTKNVQRSQKVIDKLLNKMKAENKNFSLVNKKVAGIDTYIVNMLPLQLHIGISKKTIIVSSNKFLFEQAVNGNIKTGFISKIEKEIAGKMDKNLHIFYMNIDELQKALTNFAPMINRRDPNRLEDMLSILNNFQYISTDTKIADDSALSNLYVKSRFSKSFFTSVINLVHEQINKSKARRLRKI